MLSTGHTVERYSVESVLGQGAMAVVYRVRHSSLDTSHALKVLAVSGDRVRARMIQEGRVQARVKHPNIVAVTDVLDVNGAPGLLMELVEGGTLEDWIGGRPRPLEVVEPIFLAILDALEHAHELGLVHRDLKPANILVDRSGGRIVPKVADFGLAKVLEEDGSLQRTRSGVAMGTAYYMAPEQIRDAGSVDRRADVFALGCILFELLAGDRAFQDDDVLDVWNRIRSGNCRPIPATEPRAAHAIRGAILPDRDARIPDCATLRAVLLGERTAWDDVARPVRAAKAPTAAQTMGDSFGSIDGSADGTMSAESFESPGPTLGPPVSSSGGSVEREVATTSATPPTAATPAAVPAPATQPEPGPAPATHPAPGPWRWVGAAGALLALGVAGAWGAGAFDGAPAIDPQTAPAGATAPSPTTAPTSAGSPIPDALDKPPGALSPGAAPATIPPSAGDPPPASNPPPAARAKPSAVARAPKPPPAPPKAQVEPASVVASPAPAPASSGTLRVSSVPWSKVSIDGKPVGNSGATKHTLSVGAHRVRLESSGGGTVHEATIELRADQSKTFCWDFEGNSEC